MPVTSVGDMAQQFVSMRNSGTIKSDLSRLAQSLSTGRVTDVSATLGGQTTQLSGINYSLELNVGYAQIARETGMQLSTMQIMLEKVDAARSQTSSDLLILNNVSTPQQVDVSAAAARGTFESMVASLNTRLADRSLFGGVETEGLVLATADDMLADLQTAIGGATTTAAIGAAIDFWFDDPAGGYATMGYLGDTGAPVQKRLSADRVFEIDARADDGAIRDVLKGAAFAAMANDLPAISQQTKSELLQESGLRLFASSDGLAAMQSRIGFVEARVEQTTIELTSQKTALSMAKNDLISADPFETASRLSAVQLQLETHYSVTARLSQLSLLGYL
ncbi:flagellin [Yoonia sediminilitoris]|uniref:Flagellar hook-associated protein 3 FlgL n=1 Tax=Yoonia sediminilitoris TaxID=1286148 RepID=A0A2T6K9Q4_9RHOB|nr:flagellin [Yoonia sediminilitoris]PUB11551.1 flagellar hook-associated protein 3 FlgL [Yoonia sediminilitoris]RCW91751.1 flagellar hook-associated protein 3 FlgL [Yoonia sediminilitoris]